MKLIGDPHLGRKFERNVPLDRRGERERMMFEQFEKELLVPDDLIVMVGDLFEHWYISYEHLYQTIEIILRWQHLFSNKKLILLQGNHDYSPTEGVYGAWDILELTLLPYDNIHVVRKPVTLCGVMFFPWQWDRTALEQLDDIKLWTNTAVGHWDLVDYGGDTGHLCPAGKLHENGVTNIYSGHWHLAGSYNVDGVDVTCTGSMQPMTHAEDPEGKMYVTLTAEEYARTDGATLKDRYVRVLCGPGEQVEAPETCLGFKVQKLSEEQKVEERVTLGDFDIDKILDKHLKKQEVPEEVASEIKEHLGGIA
jgi:calcineurin-like phosphoesterase family protein